ncbi:MAG: chorismate synthase [Anaerovoracaceae bacterium]|nr:chorismate synthase [Anaerovoracaceae bacterium]
MSSELGNRLKISIFGESHGKGIGVVIDGFPAGVKIDKEELAAFTARRRPGRDKTSTARKEDDIPDVLSGVLDGVTCGTPIAAVIQNTDQHSGDYKNVKHEARPGHADYTGFVRYGGFNDVRGGGHFSARLTAPLVFAGGLCLQYLKQRGIYIGAHLASVAGVQDERFDDCNVSPEELLAPGSKKFPVIDDAAGERMREEIEKARLDADSVGGTVEAAVIGLPAGVGSPIFDTVEGRLAYGYYGIPAVKGVSFGAGFSAPLKRGSENNDEFYMEDGKVRTRTNNHGGILGGITSGMPVTALLAFKPTPSIAKPQHTIDYVENKDTIMTIKGRHDPCVAVRAVPVVEAVTAAVIMDMLLEEGVF